LRQYDINKLRQNKFIKDLWRKIKLSQQKFDYWVVKTSLVLKIDNIGKKGLKMTL